MSCITEILKIKGDRAILPILRDEKVGKAVVIEGGGHWLGFEYLITFTDLGHRCGYVAIPPGHVADKEHDRREDWDIDCHGGVTFINRKHSAKTLLGENACTDLWIGFDAAHGCDTPCIKTVEEYFGETEYVKFLKTNSYPVPKDDYASHKTFKYMERQCRKVIHQLIKMSKAA